MSYIVNLTGVQPTLVSGENIKTINGETILGSGDLTIDKTDVGLGNVDNTSDADKPISTATQTALDNKADLVGGKVPSSQIPAIAISEFLGAVNSQAAMLALLGQEGDWCIRTDVDSTYILIGTDPTDIDNWQEIVTPTGAVTSVNGYTGVVVLNQNDIGLGNVDDTSDLNKPISTATQTALNAKQDSLVSGTNIKTLEGQSLLGSGNIDLTKSDVGLSNVDNTSDLNKPISTATQTALNGKFNNPTGTSAQYIDGTGALQTFPTILDAGSLITEVYNNTGATLTKGTIVYINGGQGNLPTITKANASADATSAQTFGWVRNDITNNNNGYVIVAGKLSDLNTNGLGTGTQLYLSGTTSGAYTITKPQAPTHLVYVGVVVRDHPTQGVIEVKIQNGYEIDELHDVQIASIANNQVLQYESSTQLWKNKSLTTASVAASTDKNYITNAQQAVIGNTSGTNTGDETQATIQSKLGTASASTSGYLTSTDWNTFNNKANGNIYTTDGNVSSNRQVNLNGKNLSFTNGSGVGNFTTLLDDGVQLSQLSVDWGQISLDVQGGGTGSGLLIQPNGITINGYYKLPNSTPALNQIPYASSTSQLNFTSIKTIEGQSLLGSGNIDLTKSDVGLGNVDNTSDLNKPISTATQTALNAKQDTITLTTTGTSGAATLVGSTLNIPNYASGGLTYFTEAQSTAAPNATVPVDSLTAVSAATNADIAIRPKGTGAFTLAIPDGTATGGDKRGANAVDLQTSRTNANQVASGQWSFTAGRSNRASGSYDVALGVETVASGGLGAMAVGYLSQATGTYSYSFGYGNGASGPASVSMGYGNTASGAYSFAIGASNQATGAQSVAMGNTNIANAENSTAFGYYSRVFGVRGRWVTGQVNVTPGDCQKSIFCLSARTTDATATTVLSGYGAGAPSATNQINLQNQSAYRFKGTIIGKQSGSTNACAWDVDGLIVRGASAAATTLVVGNVNLVSNTPAWGTPTLAADTTNGGLRVQVTGLAATNIQWTAVIETTEVIYA